MGLLERLQTIENKFNTSSGVKYNYYTKRWNKKYPVAKDFSIKKKKKRLARKYKNRIPKQYNIYIKSEWWEKRKNKYYQKHSKKCALCDSKKYITLHHLIYKDYGNELDENLVALCSEHHKLFHQMYGVKGDMKKDTLNFLKHRHEVLKVKKEMEEHESNFLSKIV